MKADEWVSAWLEQGRARSGEDGVTLAEAPPGALADKLRRAYDWIAREAIVTPYLDMEFGEGVTLGGDGRVLSLHPASYSSYVLLPLLNLATSQRLLFLGAPGRGKTSMAVVMALLAGESLASVKRSVQRGHPQLTISDLLGSPLPSEMIRADDAKAIRVSWRSWLTMRVKIIDEYNRIPTKTQSALLSLMAEGYAEMFEQVVECGWSAWYLTANDDLGGGTFPVIEALKDRIDIVVRCTPYSTHELDKLAERVTSARRPLEFVPADILFSAAELATVERDIRALPLPAAVLDALGFFAGQLEFCRRASDRLEFMNKDTLHLAGRRVAQVCNEDCPLDKLTNLCSRTENGVSARAYQTLILFSKALAYFRGASAVGVEDLRQILPWVLHDKLKANPHSAFFQHTDHHTLNHDRVSWIRGMFDDAQRQRVSYEKVRPPVVDLKAELDGNLSGWSKPELQRRVRALEQHIGGVLKRSELNGPVYEDLIALKYLHHRCQEQLARLERRSAGV